MLHAGACGVWCNPGGVCCKFGGVRCNPSRVPRIADIKALVAQPSVRALAFPSATS